MNCEDNITAASATESSQESQTDARSQDITILTARRAFFNFLPYLREFSGLVLSEFEWNHFLSAEYLE